MDFERLLEWRLRVRGHHEMPLEAAEFVPHGGRAYLADWRAHPALAGNIKLDELLLVDFRFQSVAERMMKIVERYYDELALRVPSSGFHWANVKHALYLSTGCLRAASQWFQTCTAPPAVVEDIFLVVRNAMGALATSPDPVSAVAAEASAEATIRTMDQRRRSAQCVDVRIVA